MNGSGEGRIKAVLFDLGGTLEDVRCDEQLQRGALAGFRRILDRHDAGKSDVGAPKPVAVLGRSSCGPHVRLFHEAQDGSDRTVLSLFPIR